MKEITMQELLEEFHPSVRNNILNAAERHESTHIVVAENHQLDSSSCGDKSALCIGGPENTYKTIEECEGKWLGDLPSQRKYFVRYAKFDNSQYE